MHAVCRWLIFHNKNMPQPQKHVPRSSIPWVLQFDFVYSLRLGFYWDNLNSIHFWHFRIDWHNVLTIADVICLISSLKLANCKIYLFFIMDYRIHLYMFITFVIIYVSNKQVPLPRPVYKPFIICVPEGELRQTLYTNIGFKFPNVLRNQRSTVYEW